MDISLTDILVCPYCGPPYGLVLLAESVVERRVLEGTLGCANCYRRYVVRRGVADLRQDGVRVEPPPRGGGASAGGAMGEAAGKGGGGGRLVRPAAAGSAEEGGEAAAGAATGPEKEEAERLAALMGFAGGAGGRTIALVAGHFAALAPMIAAVVEEVEVVAVGEPAGMATEQPGVSHMLVGRTLPFLNRSVRGVALSGEAADTLLEEAVRVLHAMARLVVEGGPPDAATRIEAAGGRVVAVEATTLAAVAMRAI